MANGNAPCQRCSALTLRKGLGVDLGAFKERGRPNGAVHDTNERQISIESFVVEAIAHDKHRVYREADIVDLNIHLAVGRLVQQRAYFDRGGVLSENLIDKQLERDAGVHDVLDDEDVTTAQALTERVGHLNCVAALVDEPVNMHKLHWGGDVHLPHKVREKTDDTVERADTDDLTIRIFGAQLIGEFPYAALEARLADEDAVDALGSGACKAVIPPVFLCAGGHVEIIADAGKRRILDAELRGTAMNKLLQQAFEKAAELPEEEQETLAAVILAEMDADKKWDELLASPESQEWLEKMAEKVRAEHKAGRTKPLREEDFD